MNEQQQVIADLIAQTMRELKAPPKTTQRSRAWKDPEGYKYLVSWSNSVLLRYLIRLLTSSLPKSEYRRKAQLDDAARSVVRNQEEGFKRSTTKEYFDFLGFSQGSLEEVKGDIRELTEDSFLKSQPGSNLLSVSLNLGDFNKALKHRGKLEEFRGNSEEDLNFSYRPLTTLYPPLNKIRAEDLSYEIFMELINKTDYNLRILVESLEKKLQDDKKGYQIEQARIKEKFKR